MHVVADRGWQATPGTQRWAWPRYRNVYGAAGLDLVVGCVNPLQLGALLVERSSVS